MSDDHGFRGDAMVGAERIAIGGCEGVGFNACRNRLDGNCNPTLDQQMLDAFARGDHMAAEIAVFRGQLDGYALQGVRVQWNIVGIAFVECMVGEDDGSADFPCLPDRGIPQQEGMMAVDDVGLEILDEVPHEGGDR